MARGTMSLSLKAAIAGALALTLALSFWAGRGEGGPPKGKCEGVRATIAGTGGDDVLYGTPRPDVFKARGGDNVIRGLDGDDLICGGSGTDTSSGCETQSNIP